MAYEWAYEHASEIGGDQSKYFSFGASAGGNIALGLALKLIDAGKRSIIAGIVSLVPCTVHPDNVPEACKPKHKSAEENAIGAPILDGEILKFIFDTSGLTKHKADPYVCPVLHSKLAEMPPTYIATCGADPLRDDGLLFTDELDKVGVKNRLKNYPGCPHYFWVSLMPKKSEVFFQDLFDGIRFVLA